MSARANSTPKGQGRSKRAPKAAPQPRKQKAPSMKVQLGLAVCDAEQHCPAMFGVVIEHLGGSKYAARWTDEIGAWAVKGTPDLIRWWIACCEISGRLAAEFEQDILDAGKQAIDGEAA